MEFLADGAETKRLHPGWAAQAGVRAAALAAHGATGPATVLEGSRGLYAAYLHDEKTSLAEEIATLGERWHTTEIAYKCYPACHYTHAPVGALAALMREHDLRPEEVMAICGLTDVTGADLVCRPAEDKLRPRTPYDAKFSLPYCLGTQLVHGSLDVTSFLPEAIDDRAVLALAERASYELRPYGASVGRLRRWGAGDAA